MVLLISLELLHEMVLTEQWTWSLAESSVPPEAATVFFSSADLYPCCERL